MSYPARRPAPDPREGWWDPFAEIEAMRRRLDQIFAALPSPAGPANWTGEVEIHETDQGWVVEAPLPGVPPDGVDVQLTDRELSIRGEASRAQPEAGRSGRRFRYRLSLPGEVDADRADATLEHGMLTVTLPRSARTPSRKVPVRTGGAWTPAGGDTPAGYEATQAYQEQGRGYPQPGYAGYPGEAAAGRYPVPAPEEPTPGQGYPQSPGQPQGPYPGWPEQTSGDRDHPT